MKPSLNLLVVAAFLLTAAQAPVTSDYDRGVAARMSGRFEAAVEILQAVTAREPDHADARLQLGLAYLALQRLDEAEAEFERTLQLAPDYADARIGLARVAERRGNRARALEWLEPFGPAHVEAAELRARLAASPRAYQTRIDMDFGISSIDGQPDWREAALQLNHRLNGTSSVTGRAEASRRFGLDDVYGELRLDHRFSSGFSAWIAAGGTPNADFRPQWQLGTGLAARVRNGPEATIMTLDAIQARYRSGDVQTVTPGIEQYLAGGRAWATIRWINIFDDVGDHRSGWLARGDMMANDGLRLFAGIADAPDLSEGVVTDTFSLFGGLVTDLGERCVLRFSLAHDDRDSGDRLSASVGLGWRF